MLTLALFGVFYLSPIIRDTDALGPVYRPALHSYTTGGWVAYYDVQPDGTLRTPYALVVVPRDLGILDTSHVRLPRVQKNAPINVTTPQLDAIKVALATRGIDGSSLTAGSTLRSLILLIGLRLHPSFSSSTVDQLMP